MDLRPLQELQTSNNRSRHRRNLVLTRVPIIAARDDDEDDTNKSVPPPATQVHISSYRPRLLLPDEFPQSLNLRQIFAQPVAWSQLQPVHVESIKLQLTNNVSLENVVPGLAAFIPPSEWEFDLGADPLQVAHPNQANEVLSTNDSNADTAIMMSNGKPTPTRRDFHLRAKELSMSNTDAYKESQFPRGPRGAAKLAYYAQFYKHLKRVGEYWDTSLDPTEANLVKLRAKQVADEKARHPMEVDEELEGFSYSPASEEDDPMNGSTTSQPEHGLANPTTSASQASQIQSDSLTHPTASPFTCPQSSTSSFTTGAQSKHDTAQTPPDQSRDIPDLSTEKSSSEQNPPGFSDFLLQAQQDLDSTPHPIMFSPDEAQTYTGLRTSTGSAMPHAALTTTVLDFLNPILYQFGCGSYAPTDVSVHRLPVQGLLNPIEAISIYRIPTTRDGIRQRLREGPVLAVSIREVDHERPSEQKDAADAMKEVLAILTLAEERSREGREEARVRKDGWLGDAKKLRGVVKAHEPGVGERWNHWHGGWKTAVLPKGVETCLTCGAKRPEPLAEGSNVLGPAPRWMRKVVFGKVGLEKGKEWDDVSYFRT